MENSRARLKVRYKTTEITSPILKSFLKYLEHMTYVDYICQIFSAGPNLRLKHYNKCNVDHAIKDICQISEHLQIVQKVEKYHFFSWKVLK